MHRHGTSKLWNLETCVLAKAFSLKSSYSDIRRIEQHCQQLPSETLSQNIRVLSRRIRRPSTVTILSRVIVTFSTMDGLWPKKRRTATLHNFKFIFTIFSSPLFFLKISLLVELKLLQKNLVNCHVAEV